MRRLVRIATSFQYLEGAIGRRAAHLWWMMTPAFNTSKVRLEARGRGLYSRNANDFQYLEGAIGSHERTLGPEELPPFNTSKVRLEACCGLRPASWRREAFNTSKVRLEGDHALLARHDRHLSIPRRCDWKYSGDLALALLTWGFQYLEGAIGRSDSSGRARQRSSFNTSKVRLEEATLQAGHARGPLSIPRRCDWKDSTTTLPVVSTTFNTSKVRLEGDADLSTPLRRMPFQYLEGAIGRSLWLASRRCRCSFQYLEGAIGRSGLW